MGEPSAGARRCLPPRTRYRCDRGRGGAPEPNLIVRGLGRSYGDAATNDGGAVLLETRLDRFLSFDPNTAILECEAGVSLEQIIETFLPRGFFPPVTPGTKFVTLGGAIAADVHGKNHHRDGSLGEFVEDLDLLTASGGIIRCSREQEPELFWATLGGMGLTGIILQARVRLRRVESAYIAADYQKMANSDEARLVSRRRRSISIFGRLDRLPGRRSIARPFGAHPRESRRPRNPFRRPARAAVFGAPA